MTAGLRRGELAGLRWCDVNFEIDVLRSVVDQQVANSKPVFFGLGFTKRRFLVAGFIHRYSRILEHLEQSKRLVQQAKERIAESKRLQETYDELQRASDELLKVLRNRRAKTP